LDPAEQEERDLLLNQGEDDDEDQTRVIYAFVIFRSMEGVRLMKTAYNYSPW
jgi:hypothetical protein